MAKMTEFSLWPYARVKLNQFRSILSSSVFFDLFFLNSKAVTSQCTPQQIAVSTQRRVGIKFNSSIFEVLLF